MSTTTLTFTSRNNPEARESPLYCLPGAEFNFVANFWDTVAASPAPSTAVYRSTSGTGNGILTTGIFAAGSHTVTAKSVAYTKASAFTGKAEYKIEFTVTAGSEAFIGYVKIIVPKTGAM
jgi:hypothetical protein